MSDTVSIEDEWLLGLEGRAERIHGAVHDILNTVHAVSDKHEWQENFDKPLPRQCDDCANRGNCGGPNPAMKWCASRMPEKPVEGMADLHGTTEGDACLFTAEQIEAAGFVRKEDMDKAINALRAELMPEIRRAQYPKVNYTTQDDGDAD